MEPGGLIGTIGALWGKYGASGDNLKRAAYALGKARETFTQLSREVFYKVWDRAEARYIGGKALAQLQNPNYRPGKASTVYTEFHVPQQYRDTYRITFVNPDGKEHVIHTAVYNDERLTRGEQESYADLYGRQMTLSSPSDKAVVPEGFEFAHARWVLHEENIAGE